MIKVFVDKFMENKGILEDKYSKEAPENYATIVKDVVSIITSEEEYGEFNPDPERIHTVDDGDYQGTLLFIIAEKGYQPSNYWYTEVSYGSCSGCDTLQAIHGWDDEVTPEQVKDYITLALHILQRMKKLNMEEE